MKLKKYDPKLSEFLPLLRALGVEVVAAPRRYVNVATTRVILKAERRKG